MDLCGFGRATRGLDLMIPGRCEQVRPAINFMAFSRRTAMSAPSSSADSSGLSIACAALRLMRRVGSSAAWRKAVSVARDWRLSHTMIAAKSCIAACCERLENRERTSSKPRLLPNHLNLLPLAKAR